MSIDKYLYDEKNIPPMDRLPSGAIAWAPIYHNKIFNHWKPVYPIKETKPCKHCPKK